MSGQRFWSSGVWSLRGKKLTCRGKVKSTGRDDIQQEVLLKTIEAMEGFIPTLPGNSDAHSTPFNSSLH